MSQNIALGILSFPSIMMRLGVVGGIIATVGLGIIAYVTAWIMIDFKLRHMGVMHYGDAGGVVFGKWGSRIFGTGMVLKAMGLAGSHVLVGQTALSNISEKAICAVWYGFIVTIASILLSYNREWHKLWWMSFISIGAIFTASIITMVATGVQSPSVLETAKGGPIHWHAFPEDPSLMNIIGGITNVIFAYGGNMAVFSFCSEMRRPNDFKKSFALSQIVAVIAYVIVGCVIYSFGGQYTTSPALTMTTTAVRITAYSIALITIMVSGILGANVGAKYLYVSTLRNSALLTSTSWKAQFYWIGCVALTWIVGFVFSELIPFFNPILTIISSLFSVWFICGGAAFLWFYDNHPWFAKYHNDGEIRAVNTIGKKFLMSVSILCLIISVAITPLGLYSAAQSIIDGYRAGTFTHPFAC